MTLVKHLRILNLNRFVELLINTLKFKSFKFNSSVNLLKTLFPKNQTKFHKNCQKLKFCHFELRLR